MYYNLKLAEIATEAAEKAMKALENVTEPKVKSQLLQKFVAGVGRQTKAQSTDTSALDTAIVNSLTTFLYDLQNNNEGTLATDKHRAKKTIIHAIAANLYGFSNSALSRRVGVRRNFIIDAVNKYKNSNEDSDNEENIEMDDAHSVSSEVGDDSDSIGDDSVSVNTDSSEESVEESEVESANNDTSNENNELRQGKVRVAISSIGIKRKARNDKFNVLHLYHLPTLSYPRMLKSKQVNNLSYFITPQ
jgi:hypothetical protein